MATISIRNLDDETKDRLRMLAARHRHSLEAEVRDILRNSVKDASTLAPEMLPPVEPVRDVPFPADPEKPRAPYWETPPSKDVAIAMVNLELEKLGMSQFAVSADMLPD